MPEELYDWFSFYYDTLYSQLLDYEEDVSFILGLARKYLDTSPGAVLDLGCGTGSHLLEFARRGLQAVGVDNSVVALEAARLKLSSQGRFLLQDMTILDSGAEIDLAVSMLSSLGYLLDRDELRRTLRRVRAVLPASGGMIIELWQEGVLKAGMEERITVPFLDHELTRISRFHAAPPDQTRISFEFTEHAGATVVRGPVSEEHTLRVFQRAEIASLLDESGFTLLATLSGGDFQRFSREDRAVTPGDLRVIVIAR